MSADLYKAIITALCQKVEPMENSFGVPSRPRHGPIETVQDPQKLLSENRPEKFPFTDENEIPAPYKKFLETAIFDALIGKANGAKVWSEEAAELVSKAIWKIIGESVIEYNDELNWGVDTALEAHFLDKLYDADMRREDAERKLDELRQSILAGVMHSLSDTGASEPGA